LNPNLIARAEIDIAASTSRVWSALVDPDAIKQYMFGTHVTSDFKAGGPIRWKGEWNGKAYEDKGMILEAERERRLAYSHFSPLSGLSDTPENYHNVRIELEGKGNTTHVRLTQDNNADEKSREHSQKNWSMMLDGLKRFVEDPKG